VEKYPARQAFGGKNGVDEGLDKGIEDPAASGRESSSVKEFHHNFRFARL